MPKMVCLLSILVISAAYGTLDPFARSIQVDSGFPYYQARSKESIASEIRINSFRCVRLIVTDDASPDAALVEACHKEGLAVWYTSFGNGKYGTAGLPEGWESWKMVLRGKKANEVAGGFTYFCLNNPRYRAWKKKQVVETLKRVPFDGFEMAEPFWPAYKGPESESYGCLCDSCRAAFLKTHPREKGIPEFSDEKHPDYYKTNLSLYQKWMDFRVSSVVSFHEEIIRAVRKDCPKVKIAVWGIADDVPNPVETLREWEGTDGKALAGAIKPDQYVIQTDWPDWTNPSLSPDYPHKYKPFVTPVREASPKTRVIMQADIGSWENCRRDWTWFRKCERAAMEAGMTGITAYEYHLARDIYEAPLCPIEASGSSDTIKLIFNKRLDATGGTDLANYSLDAGSIRSAEVDGNIVKLTVDGKPEKVTIRNLTDDPNRRFFKGEPVVMKTAISLKVNWN